MKILKNLFHGKELPKRISDSKVEMIQYDLAEHIEMYAAAFLKETNLKPSECILIWRPVGYGCGYEYELKKKDAPQKAVESAENSKQLVKHKISSALCKGMPHGSCKGETMCDPSNVCFEPA